MAQIMIRMLLLVLLLGSTACSSTSRNFEKINIGSGTVKGNELMVGPMTFDDSWSKPVGTLGCCWQRAGASSIAHNVPFPKKVSVYWSDLGQRRIYFTDVILDHARAEKLARNLPSYTWLSDGEVVSQPDPYIILGFGEQGEVKVWLSNASTSRNKSGRVLYEIGSAQAEWNQMREDKPDGANNDPRFFTCTFTRKRSL